MKRTDTDNALPPSGQNPKALPILLIFLSWVFLAFFFVHYVDDYALSFQKGSFLSRLHILSAAFDVEDIKDLTGHEEDLPKKSYIHLKNQLKRVVASDSRLRFAYLMRKVDTKTIFLVDSESPGTKDYSPPGEVYEEASPALSSLFDKGDGLVEGPLSDRWGTWVSALVPIKDAYTRQTVAVMGLDVDASLWGKEIAIYHSFAIAICLFLFCIIFISLYFLRQQHYILIKMANSEERFRHVVDSSGDWIWETDKDGLYTYSSYAVKSILGYESDEITGKKFFYDFCFVEEREKIREEAFKTVRDGKLFIREIARRQHKDGHEVILDVRGFAIRTSKGKIVGYRGVDRDITDVKKAEKSIEENRKTIEKANQDLEANERVLLQMIKDMEATNKELKETQNQLIQSEKMATVGVLASGVAHEIKNPLAIILQGMERIEKILAKTDSKGTEYVTIVKNAAVRANKVVIALLKFSRSSQLEAEPIDVRDVIDAAVTLIENQAQAGNILINREYKSDYHTVSGDNIILEQVFFDLFSNAIDAMPQGGTITILTRLQKSLENDAKLIIEVKDTGVGIAPEHIPRMFDPFFTTKEPGKGTGLGLSTVYLILERHKGSIRMESKVNEGTVFFITLPVLRE